MDSGRLILKPSKKNTIFGFFASVPAMTAKAANRNNILHVLLENGMIDNKFFRYPEFDKILATCKLDPTNSEYKLCVDSFHHLFKKHFTKGGEVDEEFEWVRFPYGQK